VYLSESESTSFIHSWKVYRFPLCCSEGYLGVLTLLELETLRLWGELSLELFILFYELNLGIIFSIN
jgi:hypothetical protein